MKECTQMGLLTFYPEMLVNNVGVSESYQSPPHIDKNDFGWTYAFACKCGPCSSQCHLDDNA
jgi:hypothetical protein